MSTFLASWGGTPPIPPIEKTLLNRYDLNVRILLSCGMDVPSVNKKFERKLSESLEKNESTTFICIGTSSLLNANNAFEEGIATLREVVNLDQFAIDLHFFFKHSSARSLDFKLVSEIADVTVHYVLRHCQIRWLSIEKGLFRIIEQIDNLCAYFFDRVIKAKMVFGVFVSHDFHRFLIPLQTKAPIIRLLYPMRKKFIQILPTKFIKLDVFMKTDGTHLLPKKKLEIH